jgi:hypothetical protein
LLLASSPLDGCSLLLLLWLSRSLSHVVLGLCVVCSFESERLAKLARWHDYL